MKLRVLMFQSGGTFSLFFLIHLGLMVVTIYNTLNYWELGDSSKFPFTMYCGNIWTSIGV